MPCHICKRLEEKETTGYENEIHDNGVVLHDLQAQDTFWNNPQFLAVWPATHSIFDLLLTKSSIVKAANSYTYIWKIQVMGSSYNIYKYWSILMHIKTPLPPSLIHSFIQSFIFFLAHREAQNQRKLAKCFFFPNS